MWTHLLWNKTALFLFSLTHFDRNRELLKEQNKMRGKKLHSLFSPFCKYKQEQGNVNIAGKRNTCLNKTSNWPGVLHLHMVELEIIPGLGLVPRLAGPGRFAWRADTLSSARLLLAGFWFGFLFFLFFFVCVDCVLEIILRHLFTHSQEHSCPAATEVAAYKGNVYQGKV